MIDIINYYSIFVTIVAISQWIYYYIKNHLDINNSKIQTLQLPLERDIPISTTVEEIPIVTYVEPILTAIDVQDFSQFEIHNRTEPLHKAGTKAKCSYCPNYVRLARDFLGRYENFRCVTCRPRMRFNVNNPSNGDYTSCTICSAHFEYKGYNKCCVCIFIDSYRND
jgi:hypothetical protein